MLDDFNENKDNSIEDTDTLAQQVQTSQNELNTPLSNAEDNRADYQTDSASLSRGEDSNSISADLIRGHINTIILRALYERDKYGYEIITDIESKSHGQYTLKQPTLYSALKRLENQGYIKAYWKTDEVTLGGRRKYFTLTESGKAITEKNLAEWEYSRTIIDSLISDKSFDFAKPAPTAVDFTILRDSVSRVPTSRVDEKPATEVNQQPTDTTAQQVAPQPVQTSTNNVTENNVQSNQNAPQNTAEDIARRRTHENYMRLISEPVRPKPVQVEDVVPGSENIDSDKLLYNNRPETERDYKNLIDGIFFKTINNGRVQTTFHSGQTDTQQLSQGRFTANTVRLVDRGASDGVSITPSNETNRSRASKTTYNKGLTLLKSSAVVFAILIIEAILCYVFMEKLAVNWIYPTVVLLIGLLQFAVFGVLAISGYGKRSVIPTNHSYISSCIILTIIVVLIIAMLSFLLNINVSLLSDIMKMLVIPSITALNLTIFSICFKIFIK